MDYKMRVFDDNSYRHDIMSAIVTTLWVPRWRCYNVHEDFITKADRDAMYEMDKVFIDYLEYLYILNNRCNSI